MNIDESKKHIQSISENYRKGTKSEESLSFAVKCIDNQRELVLFIEKLSNDEFECFTTDRNGVIEILKKFVV